MKTLGIMGGGRWARVLLNVARHLLPLETRIFWGTTHGYDAAVSFRNAGNLSNITVVDSQQFAFGNLDAVVIATASHSHFSDARRSLDCGVPTLCEKPLALNRQHALELVQQATHQGTLLGIDLEFFYANYVQEFAAAIVDIPIKGIDIEWHDPRIEQRHGEMKHANFSVNIIHDIFPHCWSLLRCLSPQHSPQEINHVRYHPSSGVQIAVELQAEIPCQINLGRQSKRRIRRIVINGGEAVLDFSTEPGSSQILGTLTQYRWNGDRPLSGALRSFFDLLEHPEHYAAWPLAAHNCVDLIPLSESAVTQLRVEQMRQVDHASRGGWDLTHDDHRTLLIDTFAPALNEQGKLHKLESEEELYEFAKQMVQNLSDH